MLGFVQAGRILFLQRNNPSRVLCPLRRLPIRRVSTLVASAKTSREEVVRIANLAQLDFTEDEITEITPEFQKMVGFFNSMNKLDLEGIEPMSTPNDARNVLREDNPVLFPDVDSIMSEAPLTERDYIRVPKINTESTD